MDEAKLNEIIEFVIREIKAAEAAAQAVPQIAAVEKTYPKPFIPVQQVSPQASSDLKIDLPDPTIEEKRYLPRVKNPKNPAAIKELCASTTARIGVGRSGPRSNTASLLLFQADHAVTQDALYHDIDPRLLDEFGLFTVQTKITEGREQYLLRPDLGRELNDEAKKTIQDKCVKGANLQVVVCDGLSTTAIEANLRQIFPVLKQGAQNAGLSLGTPFYVKYCRVGAMNDIGELTQADVVIMLIGERPGLGRAESMSCYMGYKPKHGDNDADRDVVCNIFDKGGTNPLEAGAFIVQFAQKMIKHQASGVKLKLEMR